MSTLVLRKFAPICTRKEGMSNTAKHSNFFRKLRIRLLMKLKSSSSVAREGAGGCAGNYSRLFIEEGVMHFLCTRTASVV